MVSSSARRERVVSPNYKRRPTKYGQPNSRSVIPGVSSRQARCSFPGRMPRVNRRRKLHQRKLRQQLLHRTNEAASQKNRKCNIPLTISGGCSDICSRVELIYLVQIYEVIVHGRRFYEPMLAYYRPYVSEPGQERIDSFLSDVNGATQEMAHMIYTAQRALGGFYKNVPGEITIDRREFITAEKRGETFNLLMYGIRVSIFKVQKGDVDKDEKKFELRFWYGAKNYQVGTTKQRIYTSWQGGLPSEPVLVKPRSIKHYLTRPKRVVEAEHHQDCNNRLLYRLRTEKGYLVDIHVNWDCPDLLTDAQMQILGE